jgi:hypothetical protein
MIEEIGQLFLNAIAGTETGDSMRIRALVHNKVMLILVDSGSSHSFVSKAFMCQAGVKANAASPIQVKVANGGTLRSDTQVQGLEWWAHGYTFHTDMRGYLI